MTIELISWAKVKNPSHTYELTIRHRPWFRRITETYRGLVAFRRFPGAERASLSLCNTLESFVKRIEWGELDRCQATGCGRPPMSRIKASPGWTIDTPSNPIDDLRELMAKQKPKGQSVELLSRDQYRILRLAALELPPLDDEERRAAGER